MPYTFTDDDRAKTANNRKQQVVDDLNNNGTYRSNCYLKRIIKQFNLMHDSCSICGIVEWRGNKIAFDLDHIDGDASNCRLSNLRLLCPNCHSQTDTYKGKSINTGKKKVSDDVLLSSLKTEKTIRQALIKVGLSPRGGNYTRAVKLKNQLALSETKH